MSHIFALQVVALICGNNIMLIIIKTRNMFYGMLPLPLHKSSSPKQAIFSVPNGKEMNELSIFPGTSGNPQCYVNLSPIQQDPGLQSTSNIKNQ